MWVAVEEAAIGWVEVDQDRVAALYVSPLSSRQGVGSKLLSLAEEAIRSAGHAAARLEASPNALGFYLRRGYVRAGSQMSDGSYPLTKKFGVEYRPARPSDAHAIASLHTRSWRENYRGAYSDAFLDGELPEERMRVWRARLDHPVENQFVQLAFDAATLVGFICAYGAHDPEWGSLVDNLHVAHAAKRNGIGLSLVRHAGAWLESVYPDLGVYLFVLEINSAARRFYERLGARNAGVSTMETHGGAIVRSCRYVWPRAKLLSAV